MSQFERKLSPDTYRIYPRPTFLLLYKEPQQRYSRITNLRRKTTTTSNTLSRNSSMKMRRAISWMVASAEVKHVYEKRYKRKVPWRVNFVTLTLPTQNNVTDHRVKRMLNTWFKWCKYNYGLSNYVWRAEPQERGEIHLHIMTDCYMQYGQVCKSWNRLLRREGLLNGHKEPNSTDIHAVLDEGVKNLTAYCVDYMQEKAKKEDGEQRRAIKGRLWGCSKALSNAGKQHMKIDEDEANNLHIALQAANWESKQIEGTACYMYMLKRERNIYKWIQKSDPIYEMYSNELTAIRSTNKQLLMFEQNSRLEIT